MISTVAVGTDGSATASKAVNEAAELARRFDAKLVLLSAFDDSRKPTTDPDQDIELQWASNPAARVTSILEALESELSGSGLECETRADKGDPAEVLVRLADECGADLLVIGNRGITPRPRQRAEHGHPQGPLLGAGRQDHLSARSLDTPRRLSHPVPRMRHSSDGKTQPTEDDSNGTHAVDVRDRRRNRRVGHARVLGLFPLAIPFVLLTAVFTAPLLLIGVAAAVPVGIVAVLVVAIRAPARRIERRDGDWLQEVVRARPRSQHGLPPASAGSG